MSKTLGDRIRDEREKARQTVDVAMADVCAEAKAYTDNAQADMQTYVNEQIAAAIAKLATDNGLINNP